MKLTAAARNCALLTLPVLACAQSFAQDNAACEPINSPALASFDFTQDISRWGTQETFDLDSTHFRIRDIAINRLPIFDESNERENNALFRWINREHIPTRQKVIRDQLLFEQGSQVSSQMLFRERAFSSPAKICGGCQD